MVVLKRVGTTYLPVTDVQKAMEWYCTNLGAVCTYQDADKAILQLADQSFFLIPAAQGASNSFKDSQGNEWFGLTFEVDGPEALRDFQNQLKEQGVRVGSIEERGHAGINVRFWDEDGNAFDVWSEWRERELK